MAAVDGEGCQVEGAVCVFDVGAVLPLHDAFWAGGVGSWKMDVLDLRFVRRMSWQCERRTVGNCAVVGLLEIAIGGKGVGDARV